MRSGALALIQPAAPVAPASPPAPGSSNQRVRIVDATLSCIARFGLAKTTLDDVARAAGCSRATVYRAFPGGKDALMKAVVDTEVSRLFSELAVAMGEAGDLEDVLVAGMTLAARRIGGHPALSFLLVHEPEVVLPHLAFDHHDRLLGLVSVYAAPFLGRWLDHDQALRVAEWTTRIALSYLGCPADDVDLTDPEHARRLVRSFVLPAVRALSSFSPDPLVVGEGPARPPAQPTARSVPSPGLDTVKGEAS